MKIWAKESVKIFRGKKICYNHHDLLLNKMSFKILLRPSFARGMARVMDLGGTINKYHQESSDTQALASDWETIGTDIKEAFINYKITR